MPPGSGQAAERERNRLNREVGQYPPAERPIFAAPPEDEDNPEENGRDPKTASALSVTSLVIGISAAIMAAVFFYRSTVNIRSAENRANQALTAVGELRHTGGPAPAAMKIELMRTLRTLDAMAMEFGSEPEVLHKVETMRNEALDLIYALEDKPASEATPVAPEQAAAPAWPPAAEPSPTPPQQAH